MNFFIHKLHISEKETMIEINNLVSADIKKSGIQNGIAILYCPHSTASITIANNDPHVMMDLMVNYKKNIPTKDPKYTHEEGNSAAHIKSSTLGISVTVIINDGKMMLGQWQDIFFCDFDGPRDREFFVKILEG